MTLSTMLQGITGSLTSTACALALALCATSQPLPAAQLDHGPSTSATDGAPAEAKPPPDGISSDDLAGIRAAYEARRHAAYVVEDGHQARNPGQRWRARFDGRGSSIEPDVGGWTWGLQLERYGFAGSERELASPASVSAEGDRVTYGWDETLEEWYVNDRRGLEHGYTVRRRPPRGAKGDEGPLVITMAVRGTLRPEVDTDGRGVRFRDDGGAVTLTYTGLRAFDAAGLELEACFARLDGRLLLSVDESGARYPLTVDPIAQQAYLKASNTDQQDRFGTSVAVSGDTVVVGANLEDSSATGVNGDEGDNSANRAGAAYVFVRSATGRAQQAYLKASNTDAEDLFGWSVAVSGDTVVVGAWQEGSNATGVNGDQVNNSAPAAGAAYVFVRDGTSWSQEAYLKASNTESGDQFGRSVAVSGDTVVVGAYMEDSNATGVNGNQSDNSANNAGAAYVFIRSGTTWSQQAYLKASNSEANDLFGVSVAISENTAVVGASWEDSGATGVDGNQSDNSAALAGAAYVFVPTGTAWIQQAYLKASNTDSGDYFGESVAVSDDLAVIAAWSEDSNATGVNGDQGNDSAPAAGAAYVFARSGSSWSQQAYLKASNSESADIFGISVAAWDDTVVVGAYWEDSRATGVNEDQADNSAVDSGAAYVFARNGTTWSQDAYLKASNTDRHDGFGISVAVSGNTAVVGAHSEGSNATGVNGDQGDNSAPQAGAAYVLDLAAPFSAPFCFGEGSGAPCPCGNPGGATDGCANSGGTGAQLLASGSASVGADDLGFDATDLLAGQPALLFVGVNAVNGGDGVQFGDGLRCAGGNVVRLGTRIPDAAGAASWGPGLGAAGGWAAGDTRYFQGWYRDPTGPCGSGFNLTNGVEVTLTP